MPGTVLGEAVDPEFVADYPPQNGVTKRDRAEIFEIGLEPVALDVALPIGLGLVEHLLFDQVSIESYSAQKKAA